MAEQSYLFDFTRVDDFFENFNVNFSLSDMFNVIGYDEETGRYIYEDDTVDENFELILIFYGDDNFSRYLDENSSFTKLDESILTDNSIIMDVALDWYNRGDGEATIELHGDVTFDIGEDTNVPLKAVVLRDKVSKFVLGYSINMRPFSVTNEVVFDDDVIFWDISRFNQ